jgi:hypothetical protein
MSISLKFDASGFKLSLQQLAKAQSVIMPKVFNTFKYQTPVKTGNAKANTYLTGKNVIEANYQYAGVLDAGRGYRDGRMRGSPQAPRGMSTPAIEVMERELKAFISQQTKGK